ncbi:MAG: hypothetical protein F6J87_02225 [Spirulina sp. SIO3F2]|nr:hypothetical protein [Spirulina sp. SIO3F2]
MFLWDMPVLCHVSIIFLRKSSEYAFIAYLYSLSTNIAVPHICGKGYSVKYHPERRPRSSLYCVCRDEKVSKIFKGVDCCGCGVFQDTLSAAILSTAEIIAITESLFSRDCYPQSYVLRRYGEVFKGEVW